MLISNKFLIISFGLIILFSSNTSRLHACEKIFSGKPIELVASYEKEKYKTNLNDETNLEIVSCKDNIGEYMALSGAPIFTDMSATTNPIPQGILPTDRTCKITNSPFDISTLEETNALSFFKAQGKYIDSCLVYEITDTGGVIEPHIDPYSCQITYLSKNKILAKGKRCLIKILKNSEFKIRYDLESSCVTKAFMTKHPEITPMEIKGMASVDILGCNYYLLKDPPSSQGDTPSLAYINGDLIEYTWVNDSILERKLLRGVALNNTPLNELEFNGQNYPFALKELDYMKSIGACTLMTEKVPLNETNLTSIGFDIRLQPGTNLFPTSTGFGDIFSLWPTTYKAQVGLGAVGLNQVLKSNDQRITIKIPFLLNNTCPQSCVDGICSSPCNFNVPLAARMTLKRFNENTAKPVEYIDVWNLGGIIPPGYLGRMTFAKVLKGHTLKAGEKYELEAEFFSPSTLYQNIKENQEQFFIKLRDNTIIYKDDLQLPILRLLPEIEGFITNEELANSELPTFFESEEAGINYNIMNREDPVAFINAILDTLMNKANKDSRWPPFYDKVCSKNNCVEARGKYLTLKMNFKVKSVHPTTGAATLEDFTSIRKSTVFGDEIKQLKVLPDVKCN